MQEQEKKYFISYTYKTSEGAFYGDCGADTIKNIDSFRQELIEVLEKQSGIKIIGLVILNIINLNNL